MATNPTAVLTGTERIELEDRPAPEPQPGQVVVEVRAVGICGSDVHYFEHGRIGDFVVTGPIVLGHEASGVVVATGAGVERPAIGQRVAIEPGWPDGTCEQCRAGRYNLCPDVHFLATPPYDGAFTTLLAVPAGFAHPVPDSLSDDAAALVEPLSVAVAACRKAEVTTGSSVLVTGGGPVGTLVAAVATAAGATRVVVVEPNAARRERVRAITGAEVHDGGDGLDDGFDALIECSGATAAVHRGLALLRPAARAVLVGMGADEVPVPVHLLQAKELVVTGSFRYANAYPEAIALAAAGRVPLDALVDAHFGLDQVHDALTANRRDATLMKVVVVPGR